jgi:PleD family two-component response regulator
MDQQREAQENIVRAYAAHNLGAPLQLPSTIRLRRILWVDDKPDQNLYETLALEQLGLAITKATASRAAFSYLGAQSYRVVITDLGRPGDMRRHRLRARAQTAIFGAEDRRLHLRDNPSR